MLLTVLLIFLFLPGIIFADKTEAGNETHSWRPGVDKVVANYLQKNGVFYDDYQTAKHGT
ncbi:hypothetical protein [Thermotoga profunda]|uniref:hypothetical protein n=1 Tax=Thermotoga profunda TaxID=1508420 RepID=UPI000597732E|nr:hypothetical protein [Thermotoga profunda]